MSEEGLRVQNSELIKRLATMEQRDERNHERICEVLDDLSGWDRSMWTEEQRLEHAITILTGVLKELDGEPQPEVESSAVLGVKLPPAPLPELGLAWTKTLPSKAGWYLKTDTQDVLWGRLVLISLRQAASPEIMRRLYPVDTWWLGALPNILPSRPAKVTKETP